ncbi:hypothetical protein FFLO_01897 [Filobasidium floriforme]|uniref:Uncharacterized protein n=1 Tax=Filobasidium floriforme TaxID=5210 RepID=A0A8K0JQI4_9TREE|nr:hypothetical protein FFLO_01897 [Filobasidium floriforme]
MRAPLKDGTGLLGVPPKPMEEKTLFAWLASFTCDKFGHPGAGLNWQKLWGESDHLGTAIIWETAMIWATAIIWAKAINSGWIRRIRVFVCSRRFHRRKCSVHLSLVFVFGSSLRIACE